MGDVIDRLFYNQSRGSRNIERGGKCFEVKSHSLYRTNDLNLSLNSPDPTSRIGFRTRAREQVPMMLERLVIA